MSIKNLSASNQQPVEIVIAVTRFKDVLAGEAGGGATGYSLKLRRPDPRAAIRGNAIYIKRPGATLRFTFAAAAGGRARYFPAGITFVRTGDRNVSDAQRLGLLNFPQKLTRPEGSALVIVDTYQDKARCVRYKFSVLIQRGADGRIGIIDPDIIHEND